jgi:hypothetical protein
LHFALDAKCSAERLGRIETENSATRRLTNLRDNDRCAYSASSGCPRIYKNGFLRGCFPVPRFNRQRRDAVGRVTFERRREMDAVAANADDLCVGQRGIQIELNLLFRGGIAGNPEVSAAYQCALRFGDAQAVLQN